MLLGFLQGDKMRNNDHNSYSPRGANLPLSIQFLITKVLLSLALVLLPGLQRLLTVLCDDCKPNATPALAALARDFQVVTGIVIGGVM
jgi:hypothetical protein